VFVCTKLAEVPDVLAAESPFAVVAGVRGVAAVITEATTDSPVPGALDDTLYVRDESELNVPANLIA
jgi:hypothetical protein